MSQVSALIVPYELTMRGSVNIPTSPFNGATVQSSSHLRLFAYTSFLVRWRCLKSIY